MKIVTLNYDEDDEDKMMKIRWLEDGKGWWSVWCPWEDGDKRGEKSWIFLGKLKIWKKWWKNEEPTKEWRKQNKNFGDFIVLRTRLNNEWIIFEVPRINNEFIMNIMNEWMNEYIKWAFKCIFNREGPLDCV